jgi:hypothetical protein
MIDYAGLGIANYLPQSVVITDMAEVVPLLQANLLLNLSTCAVQEVRALLSSRYQACEHMWGTSVQPLLSSETSASSSSESGSMERHYDVIIASDVVYDPIGYDPLIQSIVALLTLSSPGHMTRDSDIIPLCIMAHRHRHPEDAKFFSSLRAQENIVVEQIDYKCARGKGADKRDENDDTATTARTCNDLNDVEIYHIYRCN